MSSFAKQPIQPPGADVYSLQRVVTELCRRVQELNILQGAGIKLTPLPGGQLLEVKEEIGGGGSSRQVWL